MSAFTKVMFGTPMYNGQCYHGYVGGLVETIKDFELHDIKFDYNFIGNESLITRGRNTIADTFLKSSCTHLCFIDADIFFPGNAIRKLLEVGEDFVCAPYPKKMIDWKVVEDKALNPVKAPNYDIQNSGASYVINYIDSSKIPKPDKNKAIEVRHAGTGFMLLSRNVFNKLKPKMKQARASNMGQFNNWYTEYFKTDVDEEGVLQSEDWVFCNDWRASGGKVYMRLDITLSHIGMHIYRGDINNLGANVT